MSDRVINNIGIKYPGLKTPERSCEDVYCPWHGHLKVRGGLLEGKVVKARMKGTIVVEREYLIYVSKYMRYERRRSRLHAHLPPCIDVSVGDTVLIGETRPISKSVSWVVLGVLRRGVSERA